jgi:hypothetical protein
MLGHGATLEMHPSGSFYVRFGRVKASLEQGLAPFPDLAMQIYPIHCLTVALAVDIVPSERLYRQIPLRCEDDDSYVDQEDKFPAMDAIQDARGIEVSTHLRVSGVRCNQ